MKFPHAENTLTFCCTVTPVCKRPWSPLPRVRVSRGRTAQSLVQLAGDRFTVAGMPLAAGEVARVTFIFGDRISVSIPAIAAAASPVEGQTFAPTGPDGEELMRLVLAITEMEAISWLAMAPAASRVC